MKNDSRDTKVILWINRVIRWGMGILFLTIGFIYKDESRWFALAFGAVFIITGFFRPNRCLQENCSINQL